MNGKRLSVDPLCAVLILLCCGTGLLLTASLEYIGAAQDITSGSVKGLFSRQLAASAVGIAAGAAAVFIGSERLCRHALPIGLAGLLLTALTFTPLGFSPEGSDDRAWLRLGSFSIQPSELLKLCFIITFAAHIAGTGSRINSPPRLLLLLLHAALPVLPVWAQGDQGTAVVFIIIAAVMLMSAGLHAGYVVGAGLAAPAAGWIVWRFFMQEHQRQRLAVLLDPSLDPLGAGFQQAQARLAVAGGGLTGSGLFSRERDLVYVSQSQNDFIFAFAGQVGGAVLCGAVILLLNSLILRITVISARNVGVQRLVAVGAAAMLFGHTFINIAMVLGFMPVIGVPLPFISSGGTALAVMTAAAALSSLR